MEGWISTRSRDIVYNELVRKLDDMRHGTLIGNRHCVLLVGSRGCGKTHMLQRLCMDAEDRGMATAALSPKLMALNESLLETIIDYTKWPAGGADVSQDALARFRGWERNWRPRCDAFTQFLAERGQNLFITIDDFEFTYEEAHLTKQAYTTWMCILSAFAEQIGPRRVIIVISGSAARLRSLAFCKLAPEEAPARFTWYRAGLGHDLNSSKFQIRTVSPFEMNRADFIEALRSVNPEWKDEDESLASLLYVNSSGKIQAFVDPALPRMYSNREALPIFEQIMRYGGGDRRELARRIVRDPFVFRSSDFDTVFTSEVDAALLYNLHDQGLVIFYDDGPVSSHRVTFSCASVLISFVDSQESHGVTNDESIALRFPTRKNEDLHEALVVESLHDSWESVRAHVAEDDGAWAQPSSAQLVRWNVQEGPGEGFPSIGTFYKEVPDMYGSDAVFVAGVDTLLCFQIKLGFSAFRPQEIENIVDMWHRGIDLYRTWGKRVIRILVTSRHITGPGRTTLADAEIKVIPQSSLANIWSGRIRAWASVHMPELLRATEG